MEEETPLQTNNISKVIFNKTNLKVYEGGVPLKMIKKIQPVLDVSPLPGTVCDVVAGIDAGGGIYTTPTDKDFYLVAAQISASDNTGSISATELSVVINGASAILLTAYAGGSVTADSNSASINPAFPIKLDRGSAITLTVNTANGSGSIVGFTFDPTIYNLSK